MKHGAGLAFCQWFRQSREVIPQNPRELKRGRAERELKALEGLGWAFDCPGLSFLSHFC